MAAVFGVTLLNHILEFEMVIRQRVAVCMLGLGLALPARAAVPERELTLEEVLLFAENNAPDIAVAERRIGVAKADVVGAAPWLPADPSIDVGGGGRFGGGQDGADASIGLSQSFELFGEPALRREAAQRGVDAVQSELDVARFRVHQAVHRSFHGALVADAEVDAADAALAFAARLVEVAEARVKAGEASSLTVRLAKTSLARAKEQVLTAREIQLSARLALGREAGFPNAQAIKPRGKLTTTALPSVESVMGLAEDRQPGLVALRARAAAAEANLALADREALPKPIVGLGYSVEGAAPSSTQTQHIVQATVSLPLPFFRGNDAERARTNAERELARAQLEGERRLLAGHVAEALTRANAARARVLLFTDEILPGLDDTLQQLELAFSLGEIDLTEVMVGREQVLTARREALLAWRTWFDALSALEAEVGTELPTANSPPSSSPSAP